METVLEYMVIISIAGGFTFGVLLICSIVSSLYSWLKSKLRPEVD